MNFQMCFIREALCYWQGAIFVLTIVWWYLAAKGLGIGWSATLGAVLALVTGVGPSG
ncbi:arsenical pump membrane protein [Escherichia coli]|uniref:Arsenical pump membrane protein n=1 Tax=Escherichia coli TaxID=562 RepID=A0A2X3LLH9_ECOLX|nr:arsenical pump membrane protein [Escherichia coli]